MEDKNEYVLVIGSKPNSEIPKIEVSHIYTAMVQQKEDLYI